MATNRMTRLLAVLTCTLVIWTAAYAQQPQFEVLRIVKNDNGDLVAQSTALPNLENASPFSKKGYSRIVRNKKTGVIDTNGRVILAPEYDKIEALDEDAFLAIVNVGEKAWVVGKEGKRIMPQLDIPNRYLRPYKLYPDEKVISAFSNGTFKIYDYSGRQLLPASYKTIQFIENGLIGITNSQDQVAVYDTKGQLVINFGKYPQLWSRKGFDALIAIRGGSGQNATGALIDRQGNRITDYKFVEPGQDGGPLLRTYLQFVSGKAGAIDATGKTVIPFEYDLVKPLAGDFYLVRNNANKTGIISSTGEVIVPCKYEDITAYYPEYNVAVVKNGSKFGLAAAGGRELTTIEYDKAPSFDKSDYSQVVKGDKMGLINKDGRVIFPVEYSFVSLPDYGVASVQKNDKFWLTNIEDKSEIITPGDYQAILNIGDGFFLIARNDKCALMDLTGKIHTGFVYRSIMPGDTKYIWIAVK